ncbi:MAG: MarR family transcriptional regulator [Alphaproteobacteria bacterium]
MERVEDCISFLIGKAAQQVARRARDLLAPHGVTPVQYAVLKVLPVAGGIAGAEIGVRLVLDSASVTGVIDRLEAAGLIERRFDPNDRRIRLIAATPRARNLLPELDAQMDRLNGEAGAAIGEGAEAFLRTLRRLGSERHWGGDV